MASETTPMLTRTEKALLSDIALPTPTSMLDSLRDQVISEEGETPRRVSSISNISLATGSVTRLDDSTSKAEPRGINMPSLDFDRVVNSYSMMATKKRLRKRRHTIGHLQKEVSGSRSRQLDERTSNISTGSSNSTHRNGLQRQPYGKHVVMWILTLATGLLCGVVGVLIMHCVEVIVNFRVAVLNHMLEMMENPDRANQMKPGDIFGRMVTWTSGHASRYLVLNYGFLGLFAIFSFYNLILASMSSVLCLRFAPRAIGSGIPEAKAYLNGVSVPSFADASTFVVKIVSSVLSVSSGLVIGQEGPLVHIGAMIGQGLTKSTKLDLAIHRLQSNFPVLTRWCGCTSLDAFGDDAVMPTPRNGQNGRPEVNASITSKRRSDINDLHEGAQSGNSVYSSDPESLHPLSSTSTLLDGRTVSSAARSSSSGGCCIKTPRNSLVSQFVSVLARFRNDTDRRDLISIGVATGFAAAFGAPVGGLLYSMEEASSFFTIPLMWRMLAATAIGTLVIAVYHGDLTHFSVLSLGDNVSEQDTPLRRFMEIPYYLLLGACGGLLGAFFNGSYMHMNRWRQKIHSHPSMVGWRSAAFKLVQVSLISLTTSSATFLMPLLLPKSWMCRDVRLTTTDDPESTNEFFDRFACNEGSTNVIAIILLGSRDDALNTILTDPSKFGAGNLLLCGVTCMFLMIITFGAALPMGLFMPTLLTGSSFGGAAGLFIQTYFLPTITPSDMALVCATSMLAGVQRTTVSLCVIMMESTGRTSVLIPLIIAVVTARYIADLFNEGFYHIVMELKEYPFLEHHLKSSYDLFSVAEVMTSPVVVVHEVESAGALEQLLLRTSVEGFPVINEDTKEYMGIIRRDQIVALLECGIFMEDSTTDLSQSLTITNILQQAKKKSFDRVMFRDDDIYTGRSKNSVVASNVDWLQDNVVKSENGLHVLIGGDDILPEGHSMRSVNSTMVRLGPKGNLIVYVSAVVHGKKVDIAAAMNRGAYTVVENTPLSKAYALFSALGLRNLPVLGNGGKVVGILSRSNFLPEHMSRRTGMDMHQ